MPAYYAINSTDNFKDATSDDELHSTHHKNTIFVSKSSTSLFDDTKDSTILDDNVLTQLHDIPQLVQCLLDEAFDLDSWAQQQPLLNTPQLLVLGSSNPDRPCSLRLHVHHMHGHAEAAWELFTDVQNRSKWDSMCDDTSVIQWIDPLTCIYHLKLKAQWPTTPRDACILTAFRKVHLSIGNNNNTIAYITVAQSVQDTRCPEETKFVRMQTRLVGNIFIPGNTKAPSFQWIQVTDADPRGYIPGSLVRKVATKTLPATVEHVQDLVDGVEPHGIYEKRVGKLRAGQAADTSSASEDSTHFYDSDLTQVIDRLKTIENTLHTQHLQNQRLLRLLSIPLLLTCSTTVFLAWLLRRQYRK